VASHVIVGMVKALADSRRRCNGFSHVSRILPAPAHDFHAVLRKKPCTLCGPGHETARNPFRMGARVRFRCRRSRAGPDSRRLGCRIMTAPRGVAMIRPYMARVPEAPAFRAGWGLSFSLLRGRPFHRG